MPAFIDKDDAAVEVFRGLPFVDRDEIQRPSNWLELATPQELAGAKIREDWPVEPPAPPAGKVLVLGPPVVEGDQVIRSYTLEDAPAPQPDPVPEEISDRQFAQALAKLDPPVITKDEALAFVKRGEVPAALQVAIDAIPDPDERFDVDMQVSGATIFRRSNPSTASLAEALKWSPAQMDGLWRFAASLP